MQIKIIKRKENGGVSSAHSDWEMKDDREIYSNITPMNISEFFAADMTKEREKFI